MNGEIFMANLNDSKLIDLGLLTKYDELLKEWVTTEVGSIDSSALHYVAIDKTNHVLKFYKESSSEISADTTPAFTVSFADVYGDVATLKADSQTEGSVAYQILSATGELGNDDKGNPYANVKSYIDAVIEAVIKDSDTKIGILNDLTTTAKSNIVSAINEIDGIIENLSTDSEVTIVETTTGLEEGILKKYTFYQGEQTDTNKIGTVNIPKDLVVTGGQVVKITDAEATETVPVGTYLKLTIANQTEPVYINVLDLVNDFTVESNATQIQLTISDEREISGEIVNGSVDANAIGTNAVITEKIKDANVTSSKLAENAVTATANVDTGVITSDVLDDVIVSALNNAVTAVQASDIQIATTTDIENIFKETV